MEWKNSRPISKSSFESCVAAVEYVLPGYKGHLPWCRACVAAWGVVHVAKHTVPMARDPAAFVGAHVAGVGHPRLGAGVVVQRAGGMRPSELLGILGMDVMLPEHRGSGNTREQVVIALGVRAGTKAKRAQTVIITDPIIVAVVRWLWESCASTDLLVGYTYAQYHRILDRACARAGISELGFTPHSPRSGFASDCIADGLGVPKTMELGRWLSETSLRTYVDITSAAAIMVSFRTRNLLPAMAYCSKHLLSFFPGAEQCLRSPPACDAAEGSQVVPHHGHLRATERGDHAVSCLSVGEVEEEGGHTTGEAAAASFEFRRGRGRGARSSTKADRRAGAAAAAAPGRSRGRGRRS